MPVDDRQKCCHICPIIAFSLMLSSSDINWVVSRLFKIDSNDECCYALNDSFKTKLAWACIFLLIFQCWADVPASGRPACPSRGFPGQRACTHSRCSVGRRPGGKVQVITHFYWRFLYCIKLDRIQLHNKTCRKSCQKSRQKSKETHRRKWTRHDRRSFLLALSCCNYRMYAGNELKMSCKCFHKDLSFPLFESSFDF